MLNKQLSNDLWWVGVLDPDLKVFDVIMKTEFGTTYNAYILKSSEKTVLFEASKAKFYNEFEKRVEEITPLNKIDYLVISHTEPDHSGTIEMMLNENPDLHILGSPGAMNFLKEIVNMDFHGTAVKDGEEISLGDKTMRFISAPNLHWPDTIFTYIPEDKLLVTCDAFGCHYCDDGITIDNVKNRDDYEKSLKFYFDMIMSPFKNDVANAVKKIDGLDIETIATGHGPVLTSEPWTVIEKYRMWADDTNPNEKTTVVIPYVSAYGYTRMLAESITEGIKSAGDIEVKLFDMVEADQGKVLDELHYADGFLLGTPTMVGEALEPIWELATEMKVRTHGGKPASAFGSFGWSGEAVPHILDRLKQLDLKIYKEGLKFRFKPNVDQIREAIEFGRGFGEILLEDTGSR